jgi:anti-sigma factor RsiW
MNTDLEMKVQAWLDGELPETEAREIMRLAETDSTAAALVRELKFTRSWLQGGETLREVPASREFYWAQIERQIQVTGQPTAPERPATNALGQWLRWLMPAAIAATLAFFILAPKPAAKFWEASVGAEIESPADDLGTFNFHSDQGHMNVVWVNSN